MSLYETNSFEHGRIENRKYYVLNDISFINDTAKWKNLKCVGVVVNNCKIKGKISTQYKYYIMDIVPKAEYFAELTRNYWQIEKGLHWTLDVHFKEDLSKSQKDNIIFNLSLLRKICYNLVKLVPHRNQILR